MAAIGDGKEIQELVASLTIEELEDGFLEIVETHSRAAFRRYAAKVANAIRLMRNMELFGGKNE
jgi:hypothetical protein